MKELKGLLSALSPPQAPLSDVTESTRLEELKLAAMVRTLQRVFGEEVHIIDPALLLQASPLAIGLVQSAGVVFYLQALRQLAAPVLTASPLAALLKPIVLLVARPEPEVREKKSDGSRQWDVDSKIRRSSGMVWAWEAIVGVLGSPLPLMSALERLIGSTGLTRLTQCLAPLLSIKLRHEEKEVKVIDSGLSSLVICLAGATLGQRSVMRLYGLVISLQQRTLYRDTAIVLLAHAASHQAGITSWVFETPSFRTSPVLFNERNPLRRAWTTQAGAIHAVECDIKGLPILTPAGINELSCSGDLPATEISTLLGLPKP